MEIHFTFLPCARKVAKPDAELNLPSPIFWCFGNRLEETQKNLKKDIKDLNTAWQTATTQRNSEKATNKATLEAAGEGLAALKEAITVLEDFYRKSSRAKTSRGETTDERPQDMGWPAACGRNARQKDLRNQERTRIGSWQYLQH